MRYEELAPQASFSSCVERFWSFGLEPQDPSQLTHIIVPDGTIGLSMTAVPGQPPNFNLIGPSITARRIEVFAGVVYHGVRFRAGAARSFLGIEPLDLVARIVPLRDRLPDLADQLASACRPGGDLKAFAGAFQAVSVGRLEQPPDRLVCRLAQRLIESGGTTAIEAAGVDMGIGVRQLRRRFLRETGLPPKAFSRLRRVRRACVDLIHKAGDRVADISFDHGYADQPHLSREVRAVFDMSPHLLVGYLRQISHHNMSEHDDRFVQNAASKT
ncbi:hypothetical protein AEAC466_11260 [Asticcacaulis sp. AC466]|uniref:helix-turn-helix domain-containing protein n=1 Tax=Asticcacaulis sp. AC466 TaxID=1282362 RepID=UPI0003C3AC2D|nr:helix-turn-helix domain-containing protein [Asticcacaulis sp. AC466]ESQ83899.1 hypothetical protein AEAC466_11260 [Asticcacaulis sp. AC466]